MSEKLTRKIKELEENRICPRCGEKMNDVLARNSLSRYCDAYICSECGTDEALRDFVGLDNSITTWYANLIEMDGK